MKRIGVLTSGGDAPGMNAAIRAVVRTALAEGMSVIGFKRGYNGLLMKSPNINENFEVLTTRSVSGIIQKGGTFLMTARCKEFLREDMQLKAIDNMRQLGVEGLVGIGGNGTFGGLYDLDKLGFPTVGIPGTIDNDLPYTDLALGYDTALNTACDCLNNVRETSESHERASLVTVMGRDCGEIAINTALASGAEQVLVPEVPWTVEAVAEKIKWGVLTGKRSMIIIFAEGAFSSLTSDVHAICERHEELRPIANDHMTSSKLAQILETLSGHEMRPTVLGYVQRGGAPTATDRLLGARFGARAVALLKDDIAGRVVGIRKGDIIDVPVAETMGKRKELDDELLRMVGILT